MSSKKQDGKVLSFPANPRKNQPQGSPKKPDLSAEDIYEDIQWGFPFEVPQIGSGSPSAEAQCRLIHRLSPSHTTINLCGPTGTGKSAIAFLIHEQSANNSKSFWEIDFADEDQLSERLENPAKIEEWIESFAGGTLFLSHFEFCGLESQTPLLNLLRMLGSRRMIQKHGTTRLLVGSEKSLEELFIAGEIKKELFHQLSFVELELAPLRGRIADILSIAENFLARESKNNNEIGYSFSNEALETLLTYHWPNNVMELLQTLQAAIERLKIDGRSLIEAKDFHFLSKAAAGSEGQTEKLKDAVRRFERAQIQRAIAQHQGSKEEAAEALGLSLASLYRKLA